MIQKNKKPTYRKKDSEKNNVPQKPHLEFKSTAQKQGDVNAVFVKRVPLFEANKIPQDARDVLNSFDAIVQGVRPLSAKQLRFLPNTIRELSHALTDERGTRRLGYMKDTQLLSAYTRYFSWWNLVRLTRLFANMPSSALALGDGEICLDVGSGPLTVVCALWLARPELRGKKITWYCMDISRSSLALGEDIYFSIVARTSTETGISLPWKIIRVAEALGADIKQKASFITCANMFNETYQDANEPPEFFAKKYSNALMSYAEQDASFLVVEPGIPKTARFVSLMRDSFLRKKLRVISPCPHAESCPMDGAHAHRGGATKWCNFSFNTENAKDIPPALQRLSESAQLGKYRAVMSFVFATQGQKEDDSPTGEIGMRIASEQIKLAQGETGFYACSKYGLMLVINNTRETFFSGDLVFAQMRPATKQERTFQIDKKSGAKTLVLN